MESISLRITPIAIIGYNLYAGLQHVDRILCMISFQFSNRVSLTITDESYFAEKHYLSEISVQIQFRDIVSITIKMKFSGISIEVFAGTQYAQKEVYISVML